MNATIRLEWWHDGAWREIGWRATDHQSKRDLKAHGAALAVSRPGHYRLVVPSILRDAPPTVLHEYPAPVTTP